MGWGGLPREGRGRAKKFDTSFETQGNQPFWAGYPGIFAGISRGCPKSLRKKQIYVQFSAPTFVMDDMGTRDCKHPPEFIEEQTVGESFFLW